MPIKFRCPCGEVLQTIDNASGLKVRCPSCDRLLRVPPPKFATRPPAATAGLNLTESKAEISAPKPAAVSEPGEKAEKARILLVIRPEGERHVTRKILEGHGYTVVEAVDGEQAVEMAREVNPSLILSDVTLPKKSGFQVIETIRDPINPRNSVCWQTPAILITDKVRGRDKQYAIALGVGGYLEKPLHPAELCSRVERLLKAGRARISR